ncbi:hypothetical protein J3Q64DRAFT_1759447 [Phycomyces blakesleeanus]|uniref:MYND-type domain-containing protein n=2 Tax=Phycomyces blakesleeanus TaxID=4837 RepID=A0A162TKS6_PHYB8|nr:hypothetical protein PHYBLDRAFT_68283 [Phycomyces blakesleeanus NRRL 1555(-)]OAD67913.1 hypothetical protein PHYBLDRAFT_68283 [Phycomyces blakesleeanus NRRL 1555(-)]|eukprot:XP_018285953.1 hypothetical protein PHYBLDRAFT_68283 [Phycomyces blakesleeanus NRRL 1555(-)]
MKPILHQDITTNKNSYVATAPILAGTVLLTQAALASIPLPEVRRQRCNSCLKKAPLQCCSRCISAYFCSNECFRNAWLHFHRVLCEPQTRDLYANIDKNQWLLERVALTLHSHAHLSKQHSHSPPYLQRAIEALEAHKKIGTDILPDNTAIETLLKQCEMSLEELGELSHLVRRTAFVIQDPDQHLDPIALGLYPLTSLHIPHSCQPNAGVIYKGSQQVVIAVTDISADEPITLSYVDLVSTKQDRLEALQARFGPEYVCHCARCEATDGIDYLLERCPPKDISHIPQEIKTWSVLDKVKLYSAKKSAPGTITPGHELDVPDFTHYTSHCMSPDYYLATIQHRRHPLNGFELETREERARFAARLEFTMQALSKIPELHCLNLATIRTIEGLMQQRMAESNWVEAMRCSLYLLVVYKLIFPVLHPTVTYHTLVLARASWNSLVQLELTGIGKRLERIYENGVRMWIYVARTSVAITFGQDTSLWREVVELEWVFERDQKLKQQQQQHQQQ